MMMISCFDHSTVMAKPWADAGFECYCVDVQHPRGEHRDGNIVRVGADLLDWLPPAGEVVFAAFFPPCTDLAASGAQYFRDKGLGRLIRGLSLFKRSVDIAELLRCRYMIENPVGTVSTYWRKPDFKFDPCDYGDPYTKRTCLWVGGGFVMPAATPVEPTEGSKMHMISPLRHEPGERARLRSVTPEGFARAVFEANAPW
jgi:hypothetical protein